MANKRQSIGSYYIGTTDRFVLKFLIVFKLVGVIDFIYGFVGYIKWNTIVVGSLLVGVGIRGLMAGFRGSIWSARQYMYSLGKIRHLIIINV